MNNPGLDKLLMGNVICPQIRGSENMENFKKGLYYFFGRVYVPKSIENCNEDILLHISDTPYNFFPGLRRLIKEIKPKYIIHTGDMVDNIKLELYPGRRAEYKKKVKVLIDILENSLASKIYLVLGNHDDTSIVTSFAKRSTVVEKSKVIELDGTKYKISHFSEEIIKAPEMYNLFGHDLSLSSKVEDDRVYLNGISGINIITLKNKNVFVLSYPYGTNEDRLCKSNLGL